MDARTRFNFFRGGVTGTSGSIERDFAIINANLNREIMKIKGRTTKGLLLAAIEIRRDMESMPPLIPVDYGNLKASFFIVPTKRSNTIPVHTFSKGSFKHAATPQILTKLKIGHKEAVSEAEAEVNKHEVAVMMGFSAFYAAPVHEMLGDVNWSLSGSGPKFFQAAIFRNFNTILAIVKANTMIP